MNLIETEYYKCTQTIPGYIFNDVYHKNTLNFNPDNYPKVFTKVYSFPTNENICIGENVYRITPDGYYNHKVKCTKFSLEHLKLEIFPTFEKANEKLEKMQKEKENLKENSFINNFLEQLNIITSVEIEKLSISEIKEKFQWIKDYLKMIK